MERFQGVLTPEQIKAYKLEQQYRSHFIQYCAQSLPVNSTHNTQDINEASKPQAVY